MEGSALEAPRENRKTCQIEGCNEITVGSRTALCRKHRNNKYKQNYKKKKRKAQGLDELQSESIENQLAEEKCFMEQKYASMLQQVLVQKQLELLQSEKVVQVLRNHQQKVKVQKEREIQEGRRRALQEEQQPQKGEQKKEAVLDTPSSLRISSAPETNNYSCTLRAESSVMPAKDDKAEPGNARVQAKAGKNSGTVQIKRNSGKEQTSKNTGKILSAKDARVENSFAVLGNMVHLPLQPHHRVTSELVTKATSFGARYSSSLRKDNEVFNTTDTCTAKGPEKIGGCNQTASMTEPQNQRIDTIYCYQPNVQSGTGTSGTFTKACIDSVKHLSTGACGNTFSLATCSISSSVTHSRPLIRNNKEGSYNLNETNPYSQQVVHPSTMGTEYIYARLPQGVLSNTVTCKTMTPIETVLLQANGGSQPLFKNVVTSSSAPMVTTAGNPKAMSVGSAQQTLMSFPVTSFSQGASLPNDQTNAVDMNVTVPQTNQGLMSHNWSNQMATGRLQAQASQDDFLLQMLQGGNDTQDQLGSTSQSSTIGRLEHVIPDTPWEISIGL